VTVAPASELTLGKLSTARRSAVLRHGITVAFTAGHAGRLTAVARTRDGRRAVVARGKRTLKTAGPGRVTLRLTARGRRLLRRRTARLAVAVTLGSTTRTAAITVRAR
jgi:hypothetical protein